MPKIVFLDAKTLGNVPNFHLLSQLGELIVYASTMREKVLSRVQSCEVIITNKVRIDKDTIARSPKLKLICVSATGVNNVDVEFAKQQGIPVKNVVNYSTHSVVQHNFAILFYLLEQLKYYDQYVQSGKYIHNDTFTHLGREYCELHGKNFGIIGLGAIGRQVATIATAFGAKVMYYSTSGKNDNAEYQRVELTELLQSSDVVSVHAPLTEATANLLDYAKLCLMKPSAFFLNTGRGGIVIEKDLAKVLDDNRIAGAGIDVLDKEPMVADHPLLSIRNKDKLIITPHIAWSSIEARTALIENVAMHIRDFIESTK
jgi:lactate dehydrogenase-like 2-hydroxyacid dehydrogenase